MSTASSEQALHCVEGQVVFKTLPRVQKGRVQQSFACSVLGCSCRAYYSTVPASRHQTKKKTSQHGTQVTDRCVPQSPGPTCHSHSTDVRRCSVSLNEPKSARSVPFRLAFFFNFFCRKRGVVWVNRSRREREIWADAFSATWSHDLENIRTASSLTKAHFICVWDYLAGGLAPWSKCVEPTREPGAHEFAHKGRSSRPTWQKSSVMERWDSHSPGSCFCWLGRV